MDEYIKRKDAEETLYEYRISLTMSHFADMETCIESRGIVEGAMNVISGLPSSDVVPKSEVEKFAEEIKLEFYREFDEIIPSIMADKIAELKKKYTESEDKE